MAVFKDIHGENWSVNITYAAVERVRKNVVGVDGKPLDLLEIAERGDFGAISGSIRKIIEVVFWICYPEISQHAGGGSTQELEEAFGESLNGDTIIEMVQAWEDAMINFIPNRQIREAVMAVMEKQKKLQERVIQKAETSALEEITGGLDALSGNTPANSESTPTLSASAN